MANAAYKGIFNDEIVRGIDNQLSNPPERYVILTDKEIIVSFRGSVSAEDWLVSDVAIVANIQKIAPRFIREKKAVLEVRQKYPDKKIVLTGHSLGGTIALTIAHEFPWVQAVAFNPGTSITTRWEKDNMTIVYLNTDFISRFAKKSINSDADIIRIKEIRNKNPFAKALSALSPKKIKERHSGKRFENIDLNNCYSNGNCTIPAVFEEDAAAAKEIWFGTAPFCRGKESDCTKRNMKFVRFDKRGDGKPCWIGKKVLCSQN